MTQRIDVTPGQQFGNWTVLEEAEAKTYPSGGSLRQVKCRCTCGTVRVIPLNSLRQGRSTRCKKCMGEARKTHGKSRTPLYECWLNMHRRAGNKDGRHPIYADVRVSDKWTTFEGFLEHPPRGRYQPGMAVCRFGDSGDYEPGNCEFMTRSANARERAERAPLRTSAGKLARVEAEANGIGASTMHARLRLGWSVDRAVTQPAGDDWGLREIKYWLGSEPARHVAERNGISYSTFLNRMKKLGWEVTRAATEPPRAGNYRRRTENR